MDLLTGMEFDLFVPGFPELQNQFQLSPFWIEALLSINFIGYFLSLFFIGSLADRYGRKRLIVVGLIIFIFGSILCLWGASYAFLFIGRFLQGIGIAAPAILSFLIIADSYPIQQQQRFLAMLNGLMNTAVGIAPIIGSYVTLRFHWQGNFIILLVLAFVILGMTLLFIPAHQRSKQPEPLSLGGYLPILQAKPLMLLSITLAFIFVPYWIFVGISPLLYLKDLGVPLAHFGYYQGALALIFALGSIFYGVVIDKYDQKKMLYFSGALYIFSFLMIAWLAFIDSPNPLFITLAFLPFVIGQIIPSVILYPLCLNLMPEAKGRVSAIIGGARLVLASLGLQLAGYYYRGSFQNMGIIILISIFFAALTLLFVLKNRGLMKAACP